MVAEAKASYDLKRFAGIKRDYTPEEVEKTEQTSQNDQFRQPSIYNRHDDVCFLDQADHQSSDN